MDMSDNNLHHPASEPVIVEPTLDIKELLGMIAGTCSGAETEGEWLLYRKHMLRLTIGFGEMCCIEGTFSVQILFIARHPWFDEDMVEAVTGFGESADDALRAGTEQFCAAVLPYLLSAFDNESDTFLEADIMGEKHSFRVPDNRSVFHRGGGERTDLYALIRDKLPEYLGTKRCYWVSLYAAVMNGHPVAEARVNGAVCNGLTELLLGDAAKRRQVGFATDREFLLLIQDEKTWKRCPFTKQEVGELTFRALGVMQGIHDEASEKEITAVIRHAAPNFSLGIEIAAFIPEIVCQVVVQFLDNDGLMPVVESGKPDTELKKTQVRSYGYIEDAIYQYLRKQQPSKEEVDRILALSGKFQVLSDSIRHGVSLEELKMSQLVYFVDKNYQVW